MLKVHTDFQCGERAAGSAQKATRIPRLPIPDHDVRSTRYSDQPMSLQTRLFGMGGVGAIMLVIAAGALLSWRVYTTVQAPRSLSVFDVAPPAAPPEPQSETPPGPEQVQKEKTEVSPDRPKIELPEIQLPTENPIAPDVAKPIIDPGPPVDKTTAPESKPIPPAQKASDAKPTWEGLVLGALNKVKRYPREASFRRQQGVPYIRFVMNREGKILSVQLARLIQRWGFEGWREWRKPLACCRKLDV